MVKLLDYTKKTVSGKLTVVGSKSLSNRLLILNQLFPEVTLENASNAADTKVLIEALASNEETIDIGHAGTAMRFLTAFFASKEGKTKILTGSSRMKERPIGVLVDALRDMGAAIAYLEKEGYPPLQIKGKQFNNYSIALDGSVSSQYISALLLIAPQFSKPLIIHLQGEITSVPYIEMTLSLLHEIGVKTSFEKQTITVYPLIKPLQKTITVESDWSAVSYFYSLVALSKKGTLVLDAFYKNSLQGDSVLVDIYKQLGVKTVQKDNCLHLSKSPILTKHLVLDLKDAPDIAQTIVVTCFALGISCDLTGLHTLKIKETDRLQALKTELTKLGATVSISATSLQLATSTAINAGITIATYQDHRMAMAFAPLALRVPIHIAAATVVKKSYSDFWNDLDSVLV